MGSWCYFTPTWMSKLDGSDRINDDRINELVISTTYKLNGVYWGHNPVTNLLLASWDIQAGDSWMYPESHRGPPSWEIP